MRTRRSGFRLLLVLVSLLAAGAGCSPPPSPGSAASSSSRYEDLLAVFDDWRMFQQPKRVNGAPDYSAPAMAVQQSELAGYMRRLAAIDATKWPIPQQVDYH